MITTQEELNRLVEAAMMDMELTRATGRMWAQLEVKQFNEPIVQVFVGFYNNRGEKEIYTSIRTYYLFDGQVRFRTGHVS